MNTETLQADLIEFLDLISTGCLEEAELMEIADIVTEAYYDPEGYLRKNEDSDYNPELSIPLWEWELQTRLMVDSGISFISDTLGELYEQIMDAFDEDVEFELQVDDIYKAGTNLEAWEKIQAQLSRIHPDKGGYVAMDFGLNLDDEMEVVLVFGNDLQRIEELAEKLNLSIAPSYEALRELVHGNYGREA